MENIPLYEEYRLIERSENEINGAWRGAHLLLFFLAFVFGSFCTFCFHMLMYLFEEKCVLFPKLLLPSETRHNYIDYLPDKEPDNNDIPVDFVTTKWKDKSTCYLPTYVPLLSGVCGLVWTAMFLMCSSGSQTLTGLQRSWRILPPIFIFSLAMGSLCIYSSAVTQAGLLDLCAKLSEVTGGMTTCSFHINVVTLVFEKRIRGVYQAIRLTIISAWLHTACWILAAVLAVLRVVLVVDFRLVRIRAELRGNLEKMMEMQETQVRTVSPDLFEENEVDLESQLFKNKLFQMNPSIDHTLGENDFYYVSQIAPVESSTTIHFSPSFEGVLETETSSHTVVDSSTGIRTISSNIGKELEAKISQVLFETLPNTFSSTTLQRELGHTKQTENWQSRLPRPSTSKKQKTTLSITSSRSGGSSNERTRQKIKKSNLKNTAVQTEPERRFPDVKPKVQIADSPTKIYSGKTSEDTLIPESTKVEQEPETRDQKSSEPSSSETSSSDSETHKNKPYEQRNIDSNIEKEKRQEEDNQTKRFKPKKKGDDENESTLQPYEYPHDEIDHVQQIEFKTIDHKKEEPVPGPSKTEEERKEGDNGKKRAKEKKYQKETPLQPDTRDRQDEIEIEDDEIKEQLNKAEKVPDRPKIMKQNIDLKSFEHKKEEDIPGKLKIEEVPQERVDDTKQSTPKEKSPQQEISLQSFKEDVQRVKLKTSDHKKEDQKLKAEEEHLEGDDDSEQPLPKEKDSQKGIALQPDTNTDKIEKEYKRIPIKEQPNKMEVEPVHPEIIEQHIEIKASDQKIKEEIPGPSKTEEEHQKEDDVSKQPKPKEKGPQKEKKD